MARLNEIDLQRFVGRDACQVEKIPGYPAQMSRGPISSIRVEQDSLVINTKWTATRVASNPEEWLLSRIPEDLDIGEVTFFQGGIGVSSRSYEDGTHEFGATYAGTVTVLPVGESINIDEIIQSSIIKPQSH